VRVRAKIVPIVPSLESRIGIVVVVAAVVVEKAEEMS